MSWKQFLLALGGLALTVFLVRLDGPYLAGGWALLGLLWFRAFAVLARQQNVEVVRAVGYASCVAFVVAVEGFALEELAEALLGFLFLVVLATIVPPLFRATEGSPLLNAAATLLGVLLLGLFLTFPLLLRHLPGPDLSFRGRWPFDYGAGLLLLALAAIWTAELGTAWGSRMVKVIQLAPALDPSRTLVGLLLGLLGGMAVAFFLGQALELRPGLMALLGLLAGLMGQLSRFGQLLLRRESTGLATVPAPPFLNDLVACLDPLILSLPAVYLFVMFWPEALTH